jgi:hypothetical protein
MLAIIEKNKRIVNKQRHSQILDSLGVMTTDSNGELV